MIKSLVKGKVAVYIDASNMFYSQQTLKWNIDYEKLIRYLKKECKLIKITIYFGKKFNDKHQEKFLNKLGAFGYEVKTRDVKISEKTSACCFGERTCVQRIIE